MFGIKKIFGIAKDKIDKFNNSHPGNKNALENRVNQNKEFYDRMSNLYIENIQKLRGHLLVLSGGLITFLSFAYNNNVNKNIDLSFKIGFISTFLAIIFAIIMATVIALIDIQIIKNKLLYLGDFHTKMLGFLGKIRKIDFSKSESEEYTKLNNEYTFELNKRNGGIITGLFALLINLCFIISLIVGMTSFFIYYLGVLKI